MPGLSFDTDKYDPNFAMAFMPKQQQPQPQVEQKKKSNWLLNLLPTAGGIIGGVGGGIAGAAAGGVGAIPGAAAGGAGGSAIGEFIRQKLAGESGVGYKKLATEAALGGIPLGVGKGVGIAKAGTVVAKEATEQAAKSGAKKIPVKFIEDATMSATKSPVKQTSRGLYINPTRSTVEDIYAKASEPGTTAKLGRFRTAGPAGNPQVPYIATEKTSTKIPVSTSTATKVSKQTVPKLEQIMEPASDVVAKSNKSMLTTASEDGGIMRRIGQKLRASSRDTSASSKLGSSRYGSELSKETNDYASKNILKGTKSISANSMYETADKHRAALGSAYRSSKEAVTDLSPDVKSSALKSIDKAVADNAELVGMSKRDQLYLDEIRSKVANAKTGNDYIQILSDIGKKTSDKALGGDAVAARQELHNTLRMALKDVRLNNMPETSKIAKELHLTSNFMESVGRQADRFRNNTGGFGAKGLQALSVMGEPIGRGVENVSRAASTPIGKIIGRETAPRAILGAYGTSAEQTAPTDQQAPDLQDLMSSQYQPETYGDQQPEQSQYPKENFVADVTRDMQTTGGKNVANLKMIYELMNPEPTKESIKAQDANYAGQQALNILDTLESQFDQSGGAQGRIPGLIAKGAGKIGLNNEVNVYNDARTGFLSNVARSLGEKGVLTDTDIKRITAIIPSSTDNPAEAAARWNMIRQIIAGGVERANAAYGGASSSQYDLQSIMQ
jgi:hypothetical protein